MTEVRRVGWPALRVAAVRRSARCSSRASPGRSSCSSVAWELFQQLGRGGHRAPGARVPARRSGRPHAADRRAHPRRQRHADGVRPRPHGHRAGGRAGGDRGGAAVPRARRHLPRPRAASRRRASRRISKERAMEYAHHGDALVPRQQRFGKYTRSLMKGLGVPVENRYGLRPALVNGTTDRAAVRSIATSTRAAGSRASRSFNFHMHLPHYAVTTDDANAVRVLARQPIDLSQPASVHRGRQPRVQLVRLDAARRTSGPATSCWPTRRSSARCSAPTRAWSDSGRTSATAR